MQNDEAQRLVNLVADNASKGVQVTKKNLLELSKRSYVFKLGYVLAGLGIALIASLFIFFPREMSEILKQEVNLLYGKLVCIVVVILLILLGYKYVKRPGELRQIVDQYNCTDEWARGIFELQNKIDLKMLSEYDHDLFNAVMLADLVLYQNKTLKLFRKNKMFNDSYKALLNGDHKRKRDYLEACEIIRMQVLSVLKPTLVNIKQNLRPGFDKWRRNNLRFILSNVL